MLKGGNLMEDNLVNVLANEVAEKLKEKIWNIKEEMTKFLESSISECNKEKVLEQLYIFQLYSNAYVGPDPRGQKSIFSCVNLVLNATSDEEILNSIEKLKETTEYLKEIETHPLNTMKRKLEDSENYGKVIF